MRLSLILSVVLLATPAFAEEVPLPRPRPVDRPPVTAEAPEADQPPLPRPAPLDVPSATDAPAAAPEPEATAPAEPPKPPDPHQSACPAVVAGLVDAETLPPIAEGACVVHTPLNVTGITVNGRKVPLSSPATLSCATASQLPVWAAAVDGYLQSHENTELTALNTGTSYACRNVNNAETGELSAHAFGDALDVTGFALADGRTIGLPDGWADPASPEGRTLRFAHDAACAIFTTTLGPEANALHRDHLHLDMECHGARCVARLCE